MGGSVDFLEIRTALEADVARLAGWCEASGVRFKKRKALVLPLCPKKPLLWPRLGAEWLEMCPAGKALGCWLRVAKCEPLFAQVGEEESGILGFCVSTNVATRTRPLRDCHSVSGTGEARPGVLCVDVWPC